MASRWADGLRRVKVARGTPKHVTVIYPYYMNAQFFAHQVAGWMKYPDDVCAWASIIVVDDGSPAPAKRPPDLPVQLQMFRIQEDRRWNWLAARNIGAHHAPEGWILLTDMDHVVTAETMHALIYGIHDPRVVYALSRNEHTGEAIQPHSASFLMTRQMFWAIGGYDEALSGHYGTDGEFRRRIVKHAPIHVLTDALVRYEHVDDASTTRYLRKQPEDAAVADIIKSRTSDWRPKVLSFPYQEVTC